MSDTPPGFRLIEPMDHVMRGFAPVYMRVGEASTLIIGFRVGPQHCNPRSHCHGGTWATMADILMGLAVGAVTGLAGPTISMSIDFLGAASAGAWVEGSARVLRSTPNLGFAESIFTADGEPALRANATFRRKFPPNRDLETLLTPA